MSCILILLALAISFLWNLGVTSLWVWCAESLSPWRCPNYWACFWAGWLVRSLLVHLFRQARPSK